MPFSVTCPSCSKSFQLAQEIYERKVAGKIVSIKCKQCQAGIRIDATEPGALKVLGATPVAAGDAAAQPTGAQAARARQATLIGMMGPAGKLVTQPAAPDALWAVDSGGAGEDRELDDAAIAREIASGAISAATLVWRDGMGDWLEVSKIPELAKHLPSAKKAEPLKVAAPLPAMRAKQPSAPEIATPVAAPVVKAAAPAAPIAKVPLGASAAKAAAPAAKAPAGKAPPAIPSMVDEDEDDEATMIFRTSAEAVAKLGLDPGDGEAAPVAPRPAAGRPAVAAPLPAAGRPAPAAGRPASAPLNPAPAAKAASAAKAPSAPLNPPSPKAPSAPLNLASPKAPSSPFNVSPVAKAPSPPLTASPSPAPVAAAPIAAPAPAAAPGPPLPPSRAKQPSAPVLPRGLTPPPEPAPPPPSPPPPPASDAPAAALPPVRPRQQSAAGWPRGLTPPPDRPLPHGAAPTPPPTAPPFAPTQSPFAGTGQMAQLAPNPFAVATTTDLEYNPPRRKAPFVIGGILLVLAAAGVALAVMSQGSHPPPPPVPEAPPTPAAQTPAVPPAPAETQATETPTPPAHPSDDIAGTPHPTPASSGDFSQMFAAGAEKAQKGGPTSTKPFDAEQAKTAVASVLKLVAACKEPGGPTGQSAAAVTFEASGQVSSVTIGAPFSGTSAGTCIIGAFKNAKVAPFSGLPGTISQPVSLL